MFFILKTLETDAEINTFALAGLLLVATDYALEPPVLAAAALV